MPDTLQEKKQTNTFSGNNFRDAQQLIDLLTHNLRSPITINDKLGIAPSETGNLLDYKGKLILAGYDEIEEGTSVPFYTLSTDPERIHQVRLFPSEKLEIIYISPRDWGQNVLYMQYYEFIRLMNT